MPFFFYFLDTFFFPQNFAKAESSGQTNHQDSESGRDPFIDRAELWKPLNCLVEAANRTKALKSSSPQCTVVKAEQINFPDSEAYFNKLKVREHMNKSNVQDDKNASVSTTQTLVRSRRLNGVSRRKKELETSVQALVDTAGKRERRRSPVWFSLVASTDKLDFFLYCYGITFYNHRSSASFLTLHKSFREGDCPLPQISSSYLRIRWVYFPIRIKPKNAILIP